MSSHTRSTVESVLVRQLDIRFIDARQIITEAKLNLNIHGYPNEEQAALIETEAVSIFHNQRSQQERDAMIGSYASLNAAKGFLLNGSSSSSCRHDYDYDDNDDKDDDENTKTMSNSDSSSSFSSSNNGRSGNNSRLPLSFFSPASAFKKAYFKKNNNNKSIRDDMRLFTEDL